MGDPLVVNYSNKRVKIGVKGDPNVRDQRNRYADCPIVKFNMYRFYSKITECEKNNILISCSR